MMLVSQRDRCRSVVDDGDCGEHGEICEFVSRYGIAIVVIGTGIIVGAVLVNGPSHDSRWLLVLAGVIAFGATFAAYFGGGPVMGLVTVLAMGATGGALLPLGAGSGMKAALVDFLALRPPRCAAFAR